MKRIIFVLFLTASLVLNAFCLDGIILELSGEVELKPAGASAFVRASVGDIVASNTIVSTGFRSTAIISVGSSLITVRPITRLSLAELRSTGNTENVNLNLDTGRIRVNVDPPAGSRTNFMVQSPNATASVRGTTFEFDTVNLSVEEGRVIFGGNNGPAVIVTGGGASYVRFDGTAVIPSEVTAVSLAPPVTESVLSLETTQPIDTDGDINFIFEWVYP